LKTVVKGKENIDKNIARGKEVCIKRLLAEFPNKYWPLTTVKHLQQKINDTVTVNRQLSSGRKQKVIAVFLYSIISVTCC